MTENYALKTSDKYSKSIGQGNSGGVIRLCKIQTTLPPSSTNVDLGRILL